MVTESITTDSGKTSSTKASSPKPLKGAMKVIKKLKGRIGLGKLIILLFLLILSIPVGRREQEEPIGKVSL